MSNSTVDNDRHNTLVDGIFAIALTLLVLDIRVPEVASEAALRGQLTALWPQLFPTGSASLY